MTTTATRDKKSRRRRAFTRGDRFTLSMFVGVPTFLHLTWVWFPALATIGLSFTYWNGVHLSDIKWAGLANYNTIFTASPQFYAALRNNGYWLLWFTFIATPLGILLAYQIDRKIRGSKVYESVYYIPVVLSLAVIGIIWRFMLGPAGLVQVLLGHPGIEDAIPIFGNYSINTYVILTIASWRHIGYIMLLYLAGLKSVDPSLREAAAIDGATEWQSFKKIVFPSMKPVNTIVIVITVIESLRAFDLIYIIYGTSTGWPILGMLVFTNIYGQAASMLGAAFAVILFVLSITPIVFYLKTVFSDENR
ncbi:MAG: sugar ABC transporter permease [Actinobacteria bacterium]|jgi:multiple sugar transport system permease protein/raffinose/stachyose/melibiose transport system permease protein|nr:sugar ABC transporter permease [Actinomycetota bacterium]